MMLLSAADISDDQRIFIFASSAGRKQRTASESNDTIVTKILYEEVASILRQFDGKSFKTESSSSNVVISAYAAIISQNKSRSNRNGNGRYRNSNNGINNKTRQTLSPEDLRFYKMKLGPDARLAGKTVIAF